MVQLIEKSQLVLHIKNFPKHLNTTQWNRIALSLLVALLGIGLGVGFSVASSAAKDAADADYNRRLNLFTDWQTRLIERFTRAGAVSSAFAAFALSSATVPANLSAPAVDRIKPLNPVAFERLAIDFYNDLPGLYSLQLQSGGVVAQAYPVGSIAVGLDIINLDVYKPVYKQLIEEKVAVISGPTQIQSVSGLGISVRYPVFLSANKSRESFWGIGNVLMKVVSFLNATGIDVLPQKHNIDYLMWYTELNANNTLLTHVISTSFAPHSDLIRQEGMQMQLPLAEHGKACYLNLYPRDGPVSDKITTENIIIITVATFLAAFACVFLLYFWLFVHFSYRHRHAPVAAPGKLLFLAALTLREAQPIVENTPLESVRVFNEFAVLVRQRAQLFGCYYVSDIGDRSVYVISSDPEGLLSLTKDIVGNTAIRGSVCGNVADVSANQLVSCSAAHNKTLNSSTQLSQSAHTNLTHHHHHHHHGKTATSCANTAATTPTNASHMSEISAMMFNSIYCRASAACHAAFVPTVYDPTRDVYFYGSMVVLSQLASALDQTSVGEVSWTPAFNKETVARRQKNTATLKATQQPNDTTNNINHHRMSRVYPTPPMSGAPARRMSRCSESQDRTEGGRSEPSVSISYEAAHTTPEPAAIGAIMQEGPTAMEIYRTIEERGRITLYIACCWHDVIAQDDAGIFNDNGKDVRGIAAEQSAEDPSTAMAVLNDAYLQKMTVIACERHSRGKSKNNNSRKGGAGGGRGDGGDQNTGDVSDGSTATKKQELTTVTRNATILHIALGCPSSDLRPVVELVRRVVDEERGVVISAHATTLVAAFNLLTPGGYHESRAADTVMRLRDLLSKASSGCSDLLLAATSDNNVNPIHDTTIPYVPFVCSLHRGKITALVGENGMVMCTGEAVQTGFELLRRAKQMYVETYLSNVDGMQIQNVEDLSFNTVAAIQTKIQLKKEQVASGLNAVSLFTSDDVLSCNVTPKAKNFSVENVPHPSHAAEDDDDDDHSSMMMTLTNGLCLLHCYEDISTSFDCEAVALAPLFPSTFGGPSGSTSEPFNAILTLRKAPPLLDAKETHYQSRVIFRLVDYKPSAGKKGNCNFNDEWMYRVKDDEDQCAYTTINAVFTRLAAGNYDDAQKLWESISKKETFAPTNLEGEQYLTLKPTTYLPHAPSELARFYLDKIFYQNIHRV